MIINANNTLTHLVSLFYLIVYPCTFMCVLTNNYNKSTGPINSYFKISSYDGIRNLFSFLIPNYSSFIFFGSTISNNTTICIKAFL